jgi:hypothetical protein
MIDGWACRIRALSCSKAWSIAGLRRTPALVRDVERIGEEVAKERAGLKGADE